MATNPRTDVPTTGDFSELLTALTALVVRVNDLERAALRGLAAGWQLTTDTTDDGVVRVLAINQAKELTIVLGEQQP